MVVTLSIFVAGVFLVAYGAKLLPEALRPLAFMAYGAHVLAAAGQVWMHLIYYGGGDMMTYMRNGAPMARLLEVDLARWFPQLVRMFLHMSTEMPYVHGQGGSSGSMVVLGALAVWIFDDKLPVWQCCALTGLTSTLGQIWIVRAATVMFPDAKIQPTVAKAIFFVPSVVFWSTALLKEAVAFPFLAMLLASSVALFNGKPVRGVLGLAVGAIGVGLIKGYMLAPFVIATAGAVLTARRGGEGSMAFRFFAVLGGFATAAFGLAAISVIFPEYAPQHIAETTAQYQTTYEYLEGVGQGGSNIDLSQGGDVSLSGQLSLVPLAFVNALFRPAIFEVRSIVQAAAALETLVIMLLFFRLVWRNPATLVKKIMQSPPLTFCIVFVLTFGIAVGLSTLNLGTLSRYRIPMMPFFFVLLFVLGHQTTAERAAAAPAASGPRAPRPRVLRPSLDRIPASGRRST